MKPEYVLGFLFDDYFVKLALIEKQKPDWRKGLLNGIGGKIEINETPLQALIREFKEEGGINTNNLKWKQFCEMAGDDFIVYCFVTRSSKLLEQIKTLLDEEIMIVDYFDLAVDKCISNVIWLIEMSVDNYYNKSFYAKIDYTKGLNYWK